MQIYGEDNCPPAMTQKCYFARQFCNWNQLACLYHRLCCPVRSETFVCF